MNRLVFSTLLFLALSCGGGGDSGSPEEDGGGGGSGGDGGGIPLEELPTVGQMDHYGQADFLSKVEADGELQALWSKLQGEGYASFDLAGFTRQEEGPVEVLWGEFPGKSEGILRYCKGGECVRARWQLADGKAVWMDGSGKELTVGTIGMPILLKQLQGHTYDLETKVVNLALDPPTELPEIDVTKRRFQVVSAFGAEWGDGSLAGGTIRQRAVASEAFDLVVHHPYVRAEKMDEIWLTSHPYDALVWIGQTVREEAKTDEIYKPIGMTVNAGLFGDRLYDEKRLGSMIDANPFRGPGLVVLAGCETMGDGNGGGSQPKSLPVLLDDPVRILVGFERCGDGREIVRASELFLDRFLAGGEGDTVAAALAKANDYLQEQQSKLVMVAAPATNLERRFLPDLGNFWQQYTNDGEPGDSTFNSYFHIVNVCLDGQGKKYSEDENFASAWSKETRWQGPFFSGSRVNRDNDVNLSFSGALVEIAEGSRFFFVVQGDLSPRVQGLTVYGNALISRIVLDKEKPAEFLLEFKGQGRASPYINEAGHKCEMQDPLLVSSTGEPSTFKIPVTWKE